MPTQRLHHALTRLPHRDEVADVVDLFLRQAVRDSPRSLSSRRAAVSLLIEWCAWRAGTPQPDPLRMTDPQITAFQEWLRLTPQPTCGGRPYKASTRANYEEACKEFGRVAARATGGESRWLLLKTTSSPSRHVVPRPQLTAEQMTRLADAADRDRRLNRQPYDVAQTPPGVLTPQGRCLIWMMARLLRRADDVCAINVGDLHPVANPRLDDGWHYVLTAREKYGKTVQTAVPVDVSKNLHAWITGHRAQLAGFFGGLADAAGDPLFVHPRLGRRLTRYVLGKVVGEAADLSGLSAEVGRELTPQDLRSAGITRLATLGYNLDEIAALSHHRDLRTIERYRNDAADPARQPQMRDGEYFEHANASRVVGPLSPPRRAKPPRHHGCLCAQAWPQLVATVRISDELRLIECAPSATPIPPDWAGDLRPRCAGCSVEYPGPVKAGAPLRPADDDEFAQLLAHGPDKPAPPPPQPVAAPDDRWDVPPPDDDGGPDGSAVVS